MKGDQIKETVGASRPEHDVPLLLEPIPGFVLRSPSALIVAIHEHPPLRSRRMVTASSRSHTIRMNVSQRIMAPAAEAEGHHPRPL